MKRGLYKIEAEGADVTALIADRFISLTVTDSAGEDSDTFSLSLDNRDDLLETPATGYKLRIWMGLEGSPLIDKGTYTVDEVTEGLDDCIMEISGKASNMKGTFKAQKSRTHETTTLGALTQKVAGEHGYKSAIHPELAGVKVGHVNQKGESDMNLLTRLCRQNGAIMKVTDDIITVLPVQRAENASGQALPTITISDPSESSGRVTIQERGTYGAIQVSYFDEDTQRHVNVTVKGKDDKAPVQTLKGNFKSAAEAGAAAAAKMNEHQRGKATMSLDRPLTPEIISPGKVVVTGHRKLANGSWYVETATHTVGSDGVSSTSLSLTTEEQSSKK